MTFYLKILFPCLILVSGDFSWAKSPNSIRTEYSHSTLIDKEIFSQTDQENMRVVIKDLVSLGIMFTPSYLIENLDDEDFKNLTGNTKTDFELKKQKEQSTIASESIHKYILGQSLIPQPFFEILKKFYEPYLRYIYEERSMEANRRFGSLSEDSLWELFLRTYWIEFIQIIEDKLPYDYELKYRDALKLLTRWPDKKKYVQEKIDLLSDQSFFTLSTLRKERYMKGRKEYLLQENRKVTDPKPSAYVAPPDSPMKFSLVLGKSQQDYSSNVGLPNADIDHPLRNTPSGVFMIAANGKITKSTPKRFKEFITKNCETRNLCPGPNKELTTIALHSKGGNVNASMRLGILIRNNGLSTVVANILPSLKFEASNDSRRGYSFNSQNGGICESACAYTFLGGVRRYLEARYIDDREINSNIDGQLGLHQFYNGQGQSFSPTLGSVVEESTEVSAQELAAKLVKYMLEMGVSPQYFVDSTKKPPNSMLYPKKEELRAYGVLTQEEFVHWKLAMMGEGLSAYSDNIDPNAALSRIMTYCLKPKMEAFLELTFSEEISDRDFERTHEDWQLAGWVLEFKNNTALINDQSTYSISNRLALQLKKDVLVSILRSDTPRVHFRAIGLTKNRFEKVQMFSIAVDSKMRNHIIWSMKNCI